MLEMVGPLVFAAAITLGFQTGIKALALCFAVMAVSFMLYGAAFEGKQQEGGG